MWNDQDAHRLLAQIPPLSPEREQQIREHEQAAAPGPWRVEDGIGMLGIESADVPFVLGSFHPRQRNEAEFTAHAREDIPALLAQLDYEREQHAREHQKDGESLMNLLNQSLALHDALRDMLVAAQRAGDSPVKWPEGLLERVRKLL